MTTKILSKEVKKLSLLGRIAINEKETKELQKDLEKILNFVSKLNVSCSTFNVEHIEHRNVFREDEAKTFNAAEKLLKQASETEKGFVKTRKVL